MKVLVFFGLLGGMLLAADGNRAADQDIKSLQGVWTATRVQYNGKDHDVNKYALKFVIKGKQIIIESTEAVKKEYARINLKLDTSTSPACLDMTVAEGIQKDALIEGIYQLSKDELKICAKVFGNERPTDFSSPAGSSVVLVVLKRD